MNNQNKVNPNHMTSVCEGFNYCWAQDGEIYKEWHGNSCRFIIDLRCHWRNDWKM